MDYAHTLTTTSQYSQSYTRAQLTWQELHQQARHFTKNPRVPGSTLSRSLLSFRSKQLILLLLRPRVSYNCKVEKIAQWIDVCTMDQLENEHEPLRQRNQPVDQNRVNTHGLAMTMTHSGKVIQNLSGTWPYGLECWGHDPCKKKMLNWQTLRCKQGGLWMHRKSDNAPSQTGKHGINKRVLRQIQRDEAR